MDIKVTLPDEEELRRIQEGLGEIPVPAPEAEPEQAEALQEIPEGADPMPDNMVQKTAMVDAIRAGRSEEDWQEFLPPEVRAELEANPTMFDSPPAPPEKGFLQKAGEVAVDMGKGAVHGVTRAVEEGTEFTLDRMDQFDDYFGVDILHRVKNMVAADMRFLGLGFDSENNEADFGAKNYAPQTTAGSLVSGVAQFATAYGILGAAGKATKISELAGTVAKLGKGAQYGLAAGKGMVADAVFQDPYEDRLSNLIQQFPTLQNPITEYLAADPNDSEAEARFKNVLEGAGLGLMTDALIHAFAKGLKKWRGVNKLGLSDKEMEKAAQNAFKEADEVVVKAAKEKATGFNPDDILRMKEEVLEVTPEGVVRPAETVDDVAESAAKQADAPTVKAETTATPKAAPTVQPGSRAEFYKAAEELRGERFYFRLYDLRERLGWDRDDFDDMIKELRDERVLQLQVGDTETITAKNVEDAFRDENGFLMLTGMWRGTPDEIRAALEKTSNRSRPMRPKEKIELMMKSAELVQDSNPRAAELAKEAAFKQALLATTRDSKFGYTRVSAVMNELGWSQEEFDAVLAKLWKEGYLTPTQGGTEGLNPEDAAKFFKDPNGFAFRGIQWNEKATARMQREVDEVVEALGKTNKPTTANARIHKGAADEPLSETLTIKPEAPQAAPEQVGTKLDPQPAPTTTFPVDEQAAFVEDVTAKVNGDAKPKPFVKTSSIYNAEHLPEDAQHAFDALAEAMGHERDFFQTHPMSREELIDDAAGIIERWCKMNGLEDVKHDDLLRVFAETLDAAPAIVVQHRALLDDTAMKVTKYVTENFNKMTPDELRRALADDGEATALLLHFKALSAQMDMLGTGAGRTLNAFKKNMGATLEELRLSNSLSYEEALARAKKEIKAMTPGERMDRLRGISLIDDPARKADFLKTTWGRKLWETSNEYWLNAVLSGPRTHLVNLFSNALKLGVTMPLERMAGAAFDRLRRGEWSVESEELWNEGVRAWLGMYHTMGEAWALAVKSFKMGENLLKPQSSVMDLMGGGRRKISAKYIGLDEAGSFGKLVDNLGTMVNAPTRLLMATDEFFSQLAYRSTIFTDLYLKGEDLFKRGALGGGDRDTLIRKFIKDNYDQHFGDAMSPQTMEVVKGARGINGKGLNNAMEATFTQDLAKNSISKKVQDMAAAHPAFKRIAPFIRTPVNIAMDTLAHTPFAKMTQQYKAAMAKGGRDAMLADAKFKLGTLVCAGAGLAACNGNLTGGGPRNGKAREALLETGWRPYSVKIGDNYISYDRIEPFGTILGVLADFVDIRAAWDAEDPDGLDKDMTDKLTQTAAALACSVSQIVSSKSYTQGISELLNALYNPETNGPDYFRNFALSYMAPAALSQARKIIDPEIREVRTFMEEFYNRIPGLSETLPTKYSWLTGKPVLMHGGTQAGWSPVLFDTNKPGRVAEELVRFPRAMLGPSNDIGGVKLDPQQVSDYARLHGTLKLNGRTMTEAIEKLMDSREYDYKRERIPDTKEMAANPRYNMINHIVQQYRDAAKKELFREHPELRDAILKKNPKDRNAGWAQMKSKSQPTPKESAYQKTQRKMKEGGF